MACEPSERLVFPGCATRLAAALSETGQGKVASTGESPPATPASRKVRRGNTAVVFGHAMGGGGRSGGSRKIRSGFGPATRWTEEPDVFARRGQNQKSSRNPI